ncbi:hypothetical protein CR513_47513, partial [Mucuna pruriens]
MLDLGASINVMPTSIYKSLNFGDLEPTRMTIQLANRSVVQPLGVLEDVLVQFNIFKAMKHSTEDHSLFSIDLINELVEEHFQQDTGRSVVDEADCDELWEVHNLSNSKGDIIDLANLSQEAELLKLLDQVCKLEDPEYSNNAKVQVTRTKKLLAAQVATMFTTEHELAKRG